MPKKIVPIPEEVMAERIVKGLASGEALVVETDHGCAVTLIPKYLRKYRCRFSSVQVADGVWQIRIDKLWQNPRSLGERRNRRNLFSRGVLFRSGRQRAV